MYIAIAGNIGVGKSSLTQLLAEHYHLRPVYEAVNKNPYLEDFYQDMPRYAFHSQMFFLSERLEQHLRPPFTNGSRAADGTPHSHLPHRPGRSHHLQPRNRRISSRSPESTDRQTRHARTKARLETKKQNRLEFSQPKMNYNRAKTALVSTKTPC